LLVNSNSSWRLAKVDATEAAELAEKYGVKGYPTIINFQKGDKPQPYEGPRDASGIYESLLRIEDGDVKSFKDEAEMLDAVKKFLFSTKKSGRVFAVSRHPDGASGKDKFLQQLYDAHDELWLRVGHLPVPKKDKKQQLVIFRTETPESLHQEPYDGSWKGIDVWRFIEKERFPLVSRSINPDLFDGSHTTVLLNVQKGVEDAIRVMMPFAKKNRETMRFSVVDENLDEHMKQFIERFGLSTPDEVFLNQPSSLVGSLTAIDGIKPPGGSDFDGTYVKYRLQGPITTERVKSFMEGFSNKSLKQFVKSQSPPTKDEFPHIKDVVSSTWESVVLDPSKIVFMEYYAPWCGACKQFAPVYEEFSEQVQRDFKGSVVVARMDATANDVPHDQVNHFPTLIVFPAGPKKIKGRKVFAGRSLEQLLGRAEDLMEELALQDDEL